jgi:diguanylate cyclase (GGDEF)-like protein
MAVPDEADLQPNVPGRVLSLSADPRDESAERAADLAAAATQRRLAEADRRKAADFLSSAYRDELTGALLRRPGRQQLEAAINRAQKASAPLYILFFDVDGLKAVNDHEGHPRGDQVLAATGMALRTALRSEDVIVRYGGDEFVCALRAKTQVDASAAIDRVRQTLGQLAPRVAISAGCAHLDASDSLDDVIDRADADLYNRRRRRRREQEAALNGAAAGRGGEPNEAGAMVGCGACGAQIRLSDFELVSRHRMTRRADCRTCGGTTLILMAHDRGEASISGSASLVASD